MANRPALIKTRDLSNIARAMTREGVADWQIHIETPDGSRVTICAGQTPTAAAPGKSDWD